MEEGAESQVMREARNTHLDDRDLSQEREAAMQKQIAEAIAWEMAKAHEHYQVLLNGRSTAVMPTSLKVTSSAHEFKVMDPFDWTKDMTIYQRWQMWAEKARHTLGAMKGDSEKTKISCFHHWVDSEGMAQVGAPPQREILDPPLNGHI